MLFFVRYLQEEVLWKQLLPFGTGLCGIQSLQEHNWDFSNLQDAFKEGGVLHNQKVFLFTSTEVHVLSFHGERKLTYIPVVAAIVSPCPPSDKIAIRPRDQSDEIVDMAYAKVDWVPYFPVAADWGGAAETRIFLLRYRAASLIDSINTLRGYTPYFNNPFETEEEEALSVEITCPGESGGEPITCTYDCEFDDLEEFTNTFITNGKVDKDAFKAIRERLEAQVESMRQGRDADAFEAMMFYKFYPVVTPDTPDISSVKKIMDLEEEYDQGYDDEDARAVISSYFKEKGLLRQQ
ncbi:hypothetical protein SSX86_015895 [Deinandra increscens subsp. villosa]|uniref:Uncharacterized protein n=1 Tax=Deinandra increscens subsp. villosa TaxID=3103831 RepID=A0AAP0GV48_9ASTR